MRADGAICSEYGRAVEAARVTITAETNVTVTARVTGDADTLDYSANAYAGIVASEGGNVILQAGGDVSVSAVNETMGGSLTVSAVYGIHSGYGLGANDLPALNDFEALDKDDTWRDRNGDGLDDYQPVRSVRDICGQRLCVRQARPV